ncbi:Bromodomain-containing protein [Rhizopogon salebrosus TDB-379]|nr:Bromodomain-containing protein [Rhizopogon salebrosus TDB-379]
MIAQAGTHVESVFDKQIKQLPPPAEAKATVVKKVATPPLPPPAPPAPAKKASVAPVRRPSTSVQPVIRRNKAKQLSAQPKREIHAPAPKDLPYADMPMKMRKAKVPKDDGTAEQLKYYAKILSDLRRQQHWDVAHPFYEPVGTSIGTIVPCAQKRCMSIHRCIKLDIPTYYQIIKKPMDMSTMRKKLDAGEYPNATKFFEDFKLMIRNCFVFNPSGTPVNQAGIDLQRLFDEKWKHLPPLRDVSSDEDEESEEERNRMCTSRIQSDCHHGGSDRVYARNLMALENKPAKEKKKKAPVASRSKGAASRAPKAAPATNGNKRKTTKKPVAEDDVLSFEQKDLSRACSLMTPAMSANGIVHPGQPISHDTVQKWINESTAGAGTLGNFSTHCFRRGGAQYWFMFAAVGQRWTLAKVRWWGWMG